MEDAATRDPGNISRPRPYDQLPDEPVEWFCRFSEFLWAGDKGRRSPLAVWRREQAERAHKGRHRPEKAGDSRGVADAKSVPGSWARAMTRWQWWSRAASYDIDRLAEDKRIIEESRAERRRQLLEQEWIDSQLMLEKASQALRHAPLFYERTTKFIPGEFVETEEVDPKTGQIVVTPLRTDREIVYLPIKADDIRRLFMEGGRLARSATGMTSPASQAAFERQEAAAAERDPERTRSGTGRPV